MNTESITLTRREALVKVLKGTVAVTMAVPILSAPAVPVSVPDAEFVPENDYPYFGYKPESLA